MTYMVEIPHTKEECLGVLDETGGKGTELLPYVSWGCMGGKDIGWGLVEANNEADVIKLFGGSGLLRSKAVITKVDKFSAEQIKGFHQ